MAERKIKNVFCPMCGESLIFTGTNEQPILVTKNGRRLKKILLFEVLRYNGEKGSLQLSTEPGDYSKHVSINLHPEEEVTLIHPICRKSMNKGMFIKILVEYEDNPRIYEFYLVARYEIKATFYRKQGGSGTEEFEFISSGKEFESIKQYLKDELKKITSQR